MFVPCYGWGLRAQAQPSEIRHEERIRVGCAGIVLRVWSLVWLQLRAYTEEGWAHLRGQTPLFVRCVSGGEGTTMVAFSPAWTPNDRTLPMWALGAETRCYLHHNFQKNSQVTSAPLWALGVHTAWSPGSRQRCCISTLPIKGAMSSTHCGKRQQISILKQPLHKIY